MSDLKRLREASGLSQFAAANRAGLERTRLSLAESEHISLTAKEERALRRVLLVVLRKRLGHLQTVLAEMEPPTQQAERRVST